jgi:folate-binding protein YgfZ
MNQDWQNFLKTQGAHMQDSVIEHFGDANAERLATRDGSVLCDLGQFGILRVSGEEAQSFLQNLLSNDIHMVNSTQAQISSFNSAKGRMLATLLIWREGEEYLLQLPRVQCETIRKRLSMYVLRAKVKISDVSEEIISLGLSGANAPELLRKRFGELPQSQFGFKAISHSSVIKFSETRWQINTSMPHASLLWQTISLGAQPVGSLCWDWLNIRSGFPVVLPPTQEQFVAQMVNFEVIGGVSFKKGCYPGQEIVARMQYLGKPKKRMYLAHLDSSDSPQPGDELYSIDMDGQPSGMIVNTASAPGGGYDVLASVQITSRDTQSVLWKSLQGMSLQFLPLPYTLPDV